MQNLFGYAFDDEPEKADLITELDPYLPTFGDVITTGNSRYYQDVNDDARAFLKSRTRAGFTNDFVSDQILKLFDRHDIVRPCQRLGFLKLFIGDRLVVRFKKLNRKHLPANVKTRQQRDWYSDRSLPGISDELTRLTIGYTLDALQLNVANLLVVRNHGLKDLLWEYDFTELATGSTVLATEAATTEIEPIELTPRESAALPEDVVDAQVDDERNSSE